MQPKCELNFPLRIYCPNIKLFSAELYHNTYKCVVCGATLKQYFDEKSK